MLGDHIPFTLGSRTCVILCSLPSNSLDFSGHMAGYIATMSAERQEGFEVETAQIHARLELQRSRRSKLAEVDLGGIAPSPSTYKVISLDFRSTHPNRNT